MGIDIKGIDVLVATGISLEAVRMGNGEARLRLGKNYIYTCDPDGQWQNSHSHGGLVEIYAVDVGWMAFAEQIGEETSVKIYLAGEHVLSRPGHAHNVFLPKEAAIHTVKCGTPVPNPEKGGADWFPASAGFDAWTKSFGEAHLLALLAERLHPVEAESAAVAET